MDFHTRGGRSVHPAGDEHPAAPGTDGTPASPATRPPRSAAGRILRPIGSVLAVLTLLGLIGHFIRGRSIGLEVLLYCPLVPLGILAALAGAFGARLGRRKEGASILAIGLTAVIVSAWWMTGHGPVRSPADETPREVIRILHWNVLWGGLGPAFGGWSSIVEEIGARSPDVVILSEAPVAPLRRQLLERLGDGWTEAEAASGPRERAYKFGLAVLSRWPTHLANTTSIRNGSVAEVIVDHPSQPIRILVVDGKSSPSIPRSAFLEDVAAICTRAEGSGPGPIDIVAGDFNCVGRTRGFDSIRAAGPGYALSSQSSTGWRATWPSWLPVYDIDHVWVRRGIAIESCTSFAKLASDHRGQLVEIGLPQPSGGSKLARLTDTQAIALRWASQASTHPTNGLPHPGLPCRCR